MGRARTLLAEVIEPAVFGPTAALEVAARHLPGEPLPYDEAVAGAFEPFDVGGRWGPRWGTTWFRLRGAVPPAWAGEEVALRLEMTEPAEALLWRDGTPARRPVVAAQGRRALAQGRGPGGGGALRRGGGQSGRAAVRRRRGLAPPHARPGRRRRLRAPPLRAGGAPAGRLRPGLRPPDGPRVGGGRRRRRHGDGLRAPGGAGGHVRRRGPRGRRRQRPARGGRRCPGRSSAERSAAPTGSAPSAMPTSTPPGCGRCGRRPASAPAASPTR